ncbi:MAG TPA: site-specific integrase [Rugosimonospora sp.]|nr:site-specific integrase [Rugosimonospora sp.]
MTTLLRGHASGAVAQQDTDKNGRVALDIGAAPVSPRRRAAARVQFPARTAASDWEAARQGRAQILDLLAGAAFTLDTPTLQQRRRRGVPLLLDWLADQPGDSWQQRWWASGADALGRLWRQLPAEWLRQRGEYGNQPHALLCAALPVLITADVIRPSLAWFLSGAASFGPFLTTVATTRDPGGFARLRNACNADPGTSEIAAGLTVHRAAVIVATKGGALADISIGDVLELLDAEANTRGRRGTGHALLYRMLHQLGIFGAQAPASLRELGTLGQRSPEQMIDRYHLVCRPIRDLLVEYLRERQPALDYNSLESLSYYLGKLFWADLERHHPGIDSLHLPTEVATAWKQRLQTVSKSTRTPTGDKVTTVVPRISFRECLTPVRAFYLDMAHWAVEDPARWGAWVAPCPVGAEEINRRKHKQHRKSRMDARTRERLPVLPILVRTVDQQRKDTAARLNAAQATAPGQSFTAAGQTLIRAVVARASSRVWAEEPVTFKRRDLTMEEDRAFWAWGTVEVLRATGIRIEELLELTHHSLIQYRLPTTGELVPLLQIAPSKTDAERLLLVSPELADVLSAVICRIRDTSGAVPLLPSYDRHECCWRPPTPVLFQRRANGEIRPLNEHAIRQFLTTALAHTGLTDPATGKPLLYTPHDFRRIFITDAVLNGLPPHIAQVIAGHRDINVTLGYKAVYPEEAIQAHLAFLARRRALRPTEEYRNPTDQEWAEFLGHFERRKVSTGACGRAFGTPCIHEHACIRCPMLWPDPAQRQRLVEIRDNLIARIAEAEREGWLGEVEGLKVSLAGAEDKLTQVDKRPHQPPTVSLGLPSPRNPSR